MSDERRMQRTGGGQHVVNPAAADAAVISFGVGEKTVTAFRVVFPHAFVGAAVFGGEAT
jgi:hypothetical protein